VNIVLYILFWGSLLALFHSYLLFPILLDTRLRSRKGKPVSDTADYTPYVSIIIPAYNENAVIGEKITSVYQSVYPSDKMEVFVMSDASTDGTDDIITRLQKEYSSLYYFRSEKRIGKPSILNRLVKQATGEIVILTDANIMLSPDTIRLLTRHFKEPETGLVDTNLISIGEKDSRGIAFQEKKYTNREIRIKYKEGLLWGIIMGPSGACYAIRKELYRSVPSNFLVDDFYINMSVLEQGKKTIVEPEAHVYEDVTRKFTEAFRRKIRIATGNFQNLYAFRHLFRHIFRPVGFCFWSHKGIRWLGPWILFILLLSNGILAIHHLSYLILLVVHFFIFFLISIDNILGIFGKQIVILRFITHFYSMNLALAIGLIKAMKGVKTNVWEPTERNR